MTVIFLDIDGVLCTPLSVALSDLLRLPMDRQLFDPAALFWLRRLVKTTGAAVVLSNNGDLASLCAKADNLAAKIREWADGR